MSRKQKLSKRIAHTILAMSIVYSGGMNVLCNTALAAADGSHGAENIKTGIVLDDSYVGSPIAGGNGTDGTGSQADDGTNPADNGGRGGDGGAASASGTIASNSGDSELVANGGTGGVGGKLTEGLKKPTDGQLSEGSSGAGGNGGAATLVFSVASGEVTTQNLSLTAAGGSGGESGAGWSGHGSDTATGDGGQGGKAVVTVSVAGTKLNAAAITLTATGGNGGDADNNYRMPLYPSGSVNVPFYSSGGQGGDGGNVQLDGLALSGSQADVAVNGDIIITGQAGNAGKGGSSYDNGGDAGSSGAAKVYGIACADAGLYTASFANLTVAATGGAGNNGGGIALYGSSNCPESTAIGKSSVGGAATAQGLAVNGGTLTVTGTAISSTATSGKGGTSGAAPYGGDNIAGSAGGVATAVGSSVSGGSLKGALTANLSATAEGGTGGDGGTVAKKTDSQAGKGGEGGTALAYGLQNQAGGKANISAAAVVATATAGAGGAGGNGSRSSTADPLPGGAGGNGGNAYAYGLWGGQGQLTLNTDSITAQATAGAGGTGGTGGAGYSISGATGATGAAGEAKAYGVYAESGAVVNLSAKTENGTIKIGAKAENGLVNEAYAVYADSATVLFHSKATLNTSDGTNEDNTVMTYLNNATLGFGGTSVGRTVEGGTLKLEGSNTFRFTTDLAKNQADSMVFDTIVNNGAAQYIQIGYEDAFKDAMSEGDIIPVDGEVTVLEITSLNGQSLNNFVGQASELDNPLQRFKVTPTVEIDDNKVNITKIGLESDGASETVMTLSDAQMALGSMWRIEGNNMMKRMGDLRNDKKFAEAGVWARYYRGELSADSSYDRNFSQDYTAFQGGIDKVQDYKGGKLYTGIAINRIDSNMGYSAGSGDLSSTGVGVYTSWLGSKGHYFDVIARGSKLNNDMKLVDMSGNSGKADYSTWAYGISAEYGYRQELQAGWFVEPQAELSLGHINSVDYTTSNGVSIKQDGANSAVTRLGVVGGKEFTINDRPSNAYVKASVLHDFGGNGGATAYYGTDSLAMQAGDMMGTWYEVGVGMNLSVAKNSNLYFDALKTFKGSIRTDWQINAGLRFTF